jgi:hypothetical protein
MIEKLKKHAITLETNKTHELIKSGKTNFRFYFLNLIKLIRIQEYKDY